MESIEEAKLGYQNIVCSNTKLYCRSSIDLAGDGFKAGVEFAQRRIPFVEEQPEIGTEVILFHEQNRKGKCVFRIVSKDALKWACETHTHWRPIERK